jgi:hypothetical protein
MEFINSLNWSDILLDIGIVAIRLLAILVFSCKIHREKDNK